MFRLAQAQALEPFHLTSEFIKRELAHESSYFNAIDGGLLTRVAFEMLDLMKGSLEAMELKYELAVLGDGRSA